MSEMAVMEREINLLIDTVPFINWPLSKMDIALVVNVCGEDCWLNCSWGQHVMYFWISSGHKTLTLRGGLTSVGANGSSQHTLWMSWGNFACECFMLANSALQMSIANRSN